MIRSVHPMVSAKAAIRKRPQASFSLKMSSSASYARFVVLIIESMYFMLTKPIRLYMIATLNCNKICHGLYLWFDLYPHLGK